MRMRRIIALLLALSLPCAAGLAEADRTLERFEYSEFGGMENRSLNMALAADDTRGGCAVTIEERFGGRTTTARYAASRRALEDMDAFLRANCPPEDWEALPESEIFAMDAPTTLLRAAYSDGTEYSLDDGKVLPEDSGPLHWMAYHFLNSYAARDAQTYEIRLSSFGGSGVTIWPVLSAPEVVDWYSVIDYGDVGDPIPPGSPYDEVFTFRGRVPGEVEVYFEVSSPFQAEPIGDEPVRPEVYRLTVDDDYNVTCEEDE